MYPDNSKQFAGSPSVPTRQTQTEMEFNELDGAIAQLGNALEELMNRLAPVLREENAIPASQEKSVQPPLVPLAGRLRQQRNVIGSLNYRVDELLRRLEL